MMELDTSPTTFLTEPCAMPFCKGCGHSHVIRKLNDALVKLQLDPAKVNLVSDIGCIGLADALFELPHSVHTTHGRSTAFATGIELADSVLRDSNLKTVVLIGDGGAMIGLLHLVNAALLNVDVTVLLCNNFLFGMTGGQNSAFSPLEFITPTTPRGNLIPPIDLCRVVEDAHAGFVARELATDHDLAGVIADAIAHPGFSLVEIVELCTEHGTSRNEISGKALREIIERSGQRFGMLKRSTERPEFGDAYRRKFPQVEISWSAPAGSAVIAQSAHTLRNQMGLVIAGSAGERVQTAAGILCEAAARSGLYASQKNDNPVTQGSGFSLSEVCLGREEIEYTGIEHPDAVVVVSADGLSELTDKRLFERLKPESTLLIDASLTVPESAATVISLPFRSLCGPGKAASGAVACYLEKIHIISPELYSDLLAKKSKSQEPFFTAKFLEAVRSAVIS